jgi:hypothetical protein
MDCFDEQWAIIPRNASDVLNASDYACIDPRLRPQTISDALGDMQPMESKHGMKSLGFEIDSCTYQIS